MNGIVHVELPTPDLEKSEAFYSAVFGWEVTRLPGQDYWLWKAPDGPGGGFTTEQVVEKAGPVIYIEVADIEATLASVAGNGGATLKEKTEIGGGMGFYALFSDNVGNRVGLWSKE